MSNPLFQQMGGTQPWGMNNMIRQFQQFQQMFKGDPRAQIQQLLNSGKVSQNDYNRAVQMAQQFQRMIGGK